MEKVALIGLGNMGAGMAGQLLRAGHPLTLWNRSIDRAKAFEEAGAYVAASPREAAERAEIVISMVADDRASRLVWTGEQGALAGVRHGSVLVESSTLSPGWVKELAIAAGEKGCDLLDAPVTGSKLHANSGELFFLAGGERRAFDRVLPVLKAMGRDAIHLGPSGSGALMKLINNFVCSVQVAGLAEGLALIEKSGLNRDQAAMVLLNGAPASPLVKTLAPRMLSRDYTVNFALELMCKDLSYAMAEGERYSVPLITAPAALKLFDRAVEQGFGQLDFSAVVEPLYAQQ
ncbi:MAG: NAD(P)-dependent oxidoreductase [Pyrinomonadaceae bacterium]|nr:NAD(P)-dependent oxidoreductase [Pyrinomonadaceae bacterium]